MGVNEPVLCVGARKDTWWARWLRVWGRGIWRLCLFQACGARGVVRRLVVDVRLFA